VRGRAALDERALRTGTSIVSVSYDVRSSLVRDDGAAVATREHADEGVVGCALDVGLSCVSAYGGTNVGGDEFCGEADLVERRSEGTCRGVKISLPRCARDARVVARLVGHQRTSRQKPERCAVLLVVKRREQVIK